ncbi:unnamed protein product [Fusarium venenatum]|uniref:Extracellular membrane protein CFEM domain-containing protein n=2 Tax=Fusarium venenatum TaxID=56646 RepID=A0A2L2TWH5_9HYPO|nr:uncharacterized protein FVRRES_08913 [Fusarium venenatum]CEI68836.1 unnamed protein product [Fusarium venenatum]
MKQLHAISFIALPVLAIARGISYVTDLAIFESLAPCISSAISYNIAKQTRLSLCDDSKTGLQECICSTRIHKVTSTISNDIRHGCGPSASEDIYSALKVMQKYCNQDKHITFSSPTTNIVDAHITDLPELAYMPPCAQSALSYAVMGVGSERCPEAAKLNAPCVCNKKDVVRDIESTLKSAAKRSCSNNADVTSAQNFYSQFCLMNEGKMSFASPKSPPGDMSYYITALPEFKSLDECARKGLSAVVMNQSSWLCGGGPQDLASCVCIKSGMYNMISSSLTESVNDYCDGTNTRNATAAADVFRYYCRAAKDLVVATVTESIVQSHVTANSSTYSDTAISRTISSAGATVTSTTHTDNAKESGSSDENEKQDSSHNNVVPIAGGVIGAAIFTALGIALFFFIRRERRWRTRGERLCDEPPQYSGHMGNSVFIQGYKPAPAVSGLRSAVLSNSRFNGGKDFPGMSSKHAPTVELQAHLARMNQSPRYSRQSGVGTLSGATESYELGSSFRISKK